jgi:hypothetical protein
MNRTLIVTIALAVAASTQGSGQAGAKRPLSIEDYYRVKAVGGVRLSDDGRTVTFTVSTRVEENNQTLTETFSAAADGTASPAKSMCRPSARTPRRPYRSLPAMASGIATLKEVALPPPAPANLTDFEKRHLDRFKGVTFDWKDFQRDGQPFPAPNLRARARNRLC